ncbi:T6SS immunity protein Tli4 family protein [Pseudomonas sp. NPDC090233]|uniref:T6SS immunity protein Tli4 family protein n=1 Tax=Pseudomonas sp. NPDC090233 TaxID=3364479 RepID=UPI003839D0F6
MRKGKRNVAGLNFEELLLKTSAEGRTVYAFRLEFPGTPELSLEPYTVLELSTVDGGPGFEGDEQAIQFWDEVVESLKRI